MVQVALHHIGAAQKYLLITAIPKIVNTTMFKETSNETSHMNSLTYALNTWTQATHTSNYQINAYTCLRGEIERMDNLRIHQGIHLKDQVSITMLKMQSNFTFDALDNAFPYSQRSNQQFAVRALTRISGQQIKQRRGISPDLRL